jgi:hypothetical protein
LVELVDEAGVERARCPRVPTRGPGVDVELITEHLRDVVLGRGEHVIVGGELLDGLRRHRLSA